MTKKMHKTNMSPPKDLSSLVAVLHVNDDPRLTRLISTLCLLYSPFFMHRAFMTARFVKTIAMHRNTPGENTEKSSLFTEFAITVIIGFLELAGLQT